MTPQTITYRSSVINYYRLGYGSQPVICFHGYGESAASFAFLETRAGDRYTFLAIDLPFHGLSKWKEGLSFSPQDLESIVEEICVKQENLSGGKKMMLLGYSLGGRICLQLAQLMPDRFQKLVLLAPDGLKVNPWYWLATQHAVGNRIFNYTMQHPRWFFTLLLWLNKANLINQSIFKFVNHYIDDPGVRQLLYDRWTALKDIKPNLPLLKKHIARHSMQVRIIYGKHDRIILPVRGKKFCKDIEPLCQLRIIAAGHQLLHEKHYSAIITALSD